MEAGDIVNFYTSAWVFKPTEGEYKNPGIILRKLDRKRYIVMWANNRVTTEFQGYLQKEEVGKNELNRTRTKVDQ